MAERLDAPVLAKMGWGGGWWAVCVVGGGETLRWEGIVASCGSRGKPVEKSEHVLVT